MNNKKLNWILYIIILVIASTISIQVYWNYKNYQINKQQLINDVQVSLDNAVNNYYENLAKKETLDFTMSSTDTCWPTITSDLESMMGHINEFTFTDSVTMGNTKKGITILKKQPLEDSIWAQIHYDKHHTYEQMGLTQFNDSVRDNRLRVLTEEHFTTKRMDWTKFNGTIQHDPFSLLTSKIVLSISLDSLNLKSMDSLLKQEFQRKNLSLNYGLSYKSSFNSTQRFNVPNIESATLSTSSKSMLFPKEGFLEVHFNNETKIILKRILSGIMISTLLVLAVISCLMYMLKVINRQKQLAEVKNDLISNITHEFKTPIATISVALESIKDFNVIDDKAKTKTYLELSTNQLSKLNIMVEKLLETATLDSESLNLNKEAVDIVQMLSLQVEKHQMQTTDKTLSFNASSENIIAKVDVFHFENAINNVIDNAMKYGGDSISVEIRKKTNNVDIFISDNGNTLTQANLNQIFEKFYRMPKGNTHDVKGFGIGLYYTKKIIEKHNGTIAVNLNGGTTFKMTIPNT